MKISIDKNELNNLVSTYFKEKYNLEGSVKIDDKGASIEIDMKSLAQISSVPATVEEPKEEVKEEVVADANAQEEQSADAITSFFTVK